MLIPANLFFAHFVSLPLLHPIPWQEKSVLLWWHLQALLGCQAAVFSPCEGQPERGREDYGCLDVLGAPDSDCIFAAKAHQSPSVPSFWALLIHRIY